MNILHVLISLNFKTFPLVVVCSTELKVETGSHKEERMEHRNRLRRRKTAPLHFYQWSHTVIQTAWEEACRRPVLEACAHRKQTGTDRKPKATQQQDSHGPVTTPACCELLIHKQTKQINSKTGVCLCVCLLAWQSVCVCVVWPIKCVNTKVQCVA